MASFNVNAGPLSGLEGSSGLSHIDESLFLAALPKMLKWFEDNPEAKKSKSFTELFNKNWELAASLNVTLGQICGTGTKFHLVRENVMAHAFMVQEIGWDAYVERMLKTAETKKIVG